MTQVIVFRGAGIKIGQHSAVDDFGATNFNCLLDLTNICRREQIT